MNSSGYEVIRTSVSRETVERVLPKALADAREVPIDPDGGLPWAYDVFPEDYVPLIEHAKALLKSMGVIQLDVARVTLIKKSAGEGRRFWHADSDAPSDPTRPPVELLVLYYLCDTSESGSLVVRPGYVKGPAHSEHVIEPCADEVIIATKPGDVVLMDPRLQHASLPNQTAQDRLMIRLWVKCEWGAK